MKKTYLFAVLFVVLALLSACAPKEAAMTQAPVVTALTVNGKDYTQADLKALGTMSVDYTGKDGATTTYEGVLLSTVLTDAGATSGTDVTFTASDGYEASLTVDEATACANCIVAFDDDTLRTVMPDMSGKLNVKDLVEITVQ
jgi:DMSO/TMAO reductase YedYZ molybdopterin-dependent catalytic subunit